MEDKKFDIEDFDGILRNLDKIENQNCQNCIHAKKPFVCPVPPICLDCSKDPKKGNWNWNRYYPEIMSSKMEENRAYNKMKKGG